MQKLSVFNQISIDGYFKTPDGDVGWTHTGNDDDEFNSWVAGNATGGGSLLFGRVTYEMMASFWPTEMAAKQMPIVAKQMNALPKIVFSKTMREAKWQNTKLLDGDLATEVRKLKNESTAPLTILGSGSIVAQLARAGLVDEFQILVIPVILGAGTTMFAGVDRRTMRLTKSRTFKNGKAYLVYEPA